MVSNLVVSLFGVAYNWPLGAAVSVVMLALTLTLLWLANRLESAMNYARRAGGRRGEGRTPLARQCHRERAPGRHRARRRLAVARALDRGDRRCSLSSICRSWWWSSTPSTIRGIIAWPFQARHPQWFGALAHDRGMLDAAVASLKLALLAVAIALGSGCRAPSCSTGYEFPGQGRVSAAGAAAAHPARDHHRRLAAHLLHVHRAQPLERLSRSIPGGRWCWATARRSPRWS